VKAQADSPAASVAEAVLIAEFVLQGKVGFRASLANIAGYHIVARGSTRDADTAGRLISAHGRKHNADFETARAELITAVVRQVQVVLVQWGSGKLARTGQK
jgi:hypothetical protein